MTDERISPPPATETNEIDETDAPRRTTEADVDRRASESAEETETNPMLREGPDAPDAADIEDPDEQL